MEKWQTSFLNQSLGYAGEGFADQLVFAGKSMACGGQQEDRAMDRDVEKSKPYCPHQARGLTKPQRVRRLTKVGGKEEGIRSLISRQIRRTG